MDRRAASMIYQKEAYTPGHPLEYQLTSKDRALMNEQTRRELEYILTMLRDEGEEATFRYLKNEVLKGRPFPWEK